MKKIIEWGALVVAVFGATATIILDMGTQGNIIDFTQYVTLTFVIYNFFMLQVLWRKGLIK